MTLSQFVGRRAELDALNDWAVPADPHPVLLFDAIGGSGKSILTWEWTTTHAPRIRGDWAGRFWYSFYERGAQMDDFCRRALAYITGRPPESFRRKKTFELKEQLLHHLQDRPWLVVLDGLERVLVAYHRFDAAQLPDEQANEATDQIAHRDPCIAIRRDDDDLLQALAAGAPSKLLITSRLVPRVLLNPANQPIPGVLRISLPGLRPADAEALLRSGGVTGSSEAIQSYLKSHCDCHPLVTGVLAGLVSGYGPGKGNFDAWAADPAGGSRLNLADLDLVQRRNHILAAALDALPEESRRLLSMLALLSEAVDYPTLSALNPHLPAEPEEVEMPRNTADLPWWQRMFDAAGEQESQEHRVVLERRERHEKAANARRLSPEFLAAQQQLENSVRDLERRGLLQYDGQTRRYDLHPVVRSVAAGRLRPEETDRYGRRLVDYFSEQTYRPYEQAETLEDIRDGLLVVRTLLKMGRYEQASNVYGGSLSHALVFNLEAYAEILSLLQPFFPRGWAALPEGVDRRIGSYLATDAGFALDGSDESSQAITAQGASLLLNLGWANWAKVRIDLSNISRALVAQNRLAREERCLLLAIDVASLIGDKEDLFGTRLDRFRQLARVGQWLEAEAMWQALDPMGREWSRGIYHPGDAELAYALFRLWKGDLTEEPLARAEELAGAGKNRRRVRALHALRGEWRLEQGRWEAAAESLHEAVRMARTMGTPDAKAETLLALARFHLSRLADPRREAEQLAAARQPFHCGLADLWLAVGDQEQAKKHALLAYRWAWADGEPYVHRYELDKARALLERLGAEIPGLPAYDPTTDEKLPWEDVVAAAIEKLRAEKATERAPRGGDHNHSAASLAAGAPPQQVAVRM